MILAIIILFILWIVRFSLALTNEFVIFAGDRVILIDLNVGLSEHKFGKRCVVGVVEHNLCNTSLNNHFGAECAGKWSGVDSCSNRTVSACFKHGRFFCVQTQAFVKVNALAYVVVATLASSLVAVPQSLCGTIVPGRNHSIVFHDNCSVSFFHAIGSWGRKLGQAHEICIECWSHELRVCEIEEI